MEDPPYVAWMKEQQKLGKPSSSIKRIAKAKRDSAGASTSSGPGHDDDKTGGDTNVSNDDLEEIVSESDSDDDSDNYKASSDDEEGDSDSAEVGSGDDRSTRQSKKEKRPPAKRNKRIWSDAELTSLAAARWNTKDDLKAMQGSLYWKKLYLKMKRSEMQNGGKAIRKNPWWDYVYHLKKHSAKANAHALDGGGAANVDIPAYAIVPGTNVGDTSAPPSQGCQRGNRRGAAAQAALLPYVPTPTPTDAVVTPPPKRRRIDETATMAAAKLVSDAIHSSNAMALRQLQDSTQLLVATMNMAAMQAGLRQQMASPPVPPATPTTTPPPAPPVDTSDANMAGSEDVAEQHVRIIDKGMNELEMRCEHIGNT
ncbi:unnamed protein product [Closterium sp. NIES-54]